MEPRPLLTYRSLQVGPETLLSSLRTAVSSTLVCWLLMYVAGMPPQVGRLHRERT